MDTEQLLTFCDYPGEVEATNNGSEQALRPCVIQRKVTNGYRAMWAAQAEADVRTAVDTARLKGANPFQTILGTLVRDVVFAEDASRIRKNPDIAARLRSFAYNLLRAAGCENIKNARWRAALDLNLIIAMPGMN
jgi:hypothetical protein